MPDFLYRTEDIIPEEVISYFVETVKDREIINALKARNPVVLAGSRGVGKSFLLRVAEHELRLSFASDRVFPVYLSFNRSSLLNTTDPLQFQHWMLARICSRVTRSLLKAGLLAQTGSAVSLMTGSPQDQFEADTQIERIASAYEESWKSAASAVDLTGLPTVETLRDAIDDLCGELNISRFVIL